MTDETSPNEPQDKRKRAARIGVGQLWGRFKSRSAREKTEALVKTVVGSLMVGGMAVGVAGYAQAQDNAKELASIDLGDGVINIPQPPDLTEAVNAAQSSADSAQGSADAAQGSADEAKQSAAEAKELAIGAGNSADRAQESADDAAVTADIAINAVPRLKVFPNQQIPDNVGTFDDPAAGSMQLSPGTYVLDYGAVFPHSYGIRLTLSDGRVTDNNCLGSGVRVAKSIFTVSDTVTATIYFDSCGPNSPHTVTSPFMLATRVQG